MKEQWPARWLAYWQPKPQAGLRLFCFPYSGAGASIFREWARLLPDEVEVCPVQLPGRESRLVERPFTHLPTLVQAAMQGLRPYLDRPFAFFGHSMGALLSFELARALWRETGLLPVHLFVSGHRAPHLPPDEPPAHDLPDEAFIARVNKLKGTPTAVWNHPELRDLLLPILRADFALCETYQYHPARPLPCPITALGGLADNCLRREELEEWRQETAVSFQRRLLPGDHFYLHQERPLLLQVLARDLAQQTAWPDWNRNTGYQTFPAD